MRLVKRLKRLVGLDRDERADIEGEDVTVHLEHPGMEDESPDEDVVLQDLKGIGPTYAEKLNGIGIDGVADLAEADAAALAAETDISETRLATWIEQARVRLEGP